MLEVHAVSQTFGDICVLNELCLRLEEGRIYTLVGENGSGKTTLFNIITGFLKPESGKLRFKGKNIAGLPPHRINRLGIGRTFQDLRLALQMTVHDNILLALEKCLFSYPSDEQKKKVGVILKMVSLSDKQNDLAGNLSYGQQKLLTIGCCIANDAELLLIDEPVTGIDKENFRKIVALVCGLRDDGKTILQIEHHHGYIGDTSDHVLQLEKGRVVYHD